MKVTEITAGAKYSLDTGHGWKAIEVGATATLTGDETLESAQQELYNRLSRQLKTLWANGNGNTQACPEQSRREGHQTPVQPAQSSATPPRPHWCSEHGVEFKQRNGPHGEFYSHQVKGSKDWRNEARSQPRKEVNNSRDP